MITVPFTRDLQQRTVGYTGTKAPKRSGLAQLEQVLVGIDGLEFVRLTGRDVVRHRIVAQIVDAYERADERVENR